MIFTVTILGSNSAIPALRRNPTAQLVNHNERFFLLDCAEGTQLQLRKNKLKVQRINHIFISHLHGDHFFGLIGLISTMHLLGRNKDLHIYGPPQLEEILQLQLDASETELIYPLIFHPIQAEKREVIYEDEKLKVSTIPLKHRIPTCGFLFQEKQGKRKLKKEKIKKLNIAPEQFLQIKDGADFIDTGGTIIKNIELTNDPDPIRSYAYCSDTAYFEDIIPLIKGADLLYHETTFMDDRAQAATDKFHSTTIEAATIAKKAGVKKLIIGHFSNRYDNPEILQNEARTIFPNTETATDGKVFEILN
jgi:ribonuclease Z